jgi:hypothetical protein
MKILFAILFIFFLAFSTSAIAQQTKPGMMQGGMMSKCKDMMAMHQQMQIKMKEMDQKLADLGQKMNQATGDQKIQAMEAVLNEMISQRNAMRDMMMSNHASMMEHMGEHMQKGAGPMMQCPMMKEMEKETNENEKE